MDWFTDVLKIAGPRVAAALAAGIAGKLTEKGISVDPATVLGVGLAVYAGVHKGLSAKVNPGDAATGRLQAAEQSAADSGSVVRVAPRGS